jgi:crotonobetainyl-CoA:carnitine CoA-transferase CaiB-like acyl-CoA transferase
MEYPLNDLKVLDFSRVLAGPFAGRMLSDLGADVVKVEPPDGDVTRYWGREIAGIPGYFHQQNAGKRNICIDLRADGAPDLVKQLVREADIVIENYRPDVMGRLGIGYEDLAAVNEKIIMLSISGFGHIGPEVTRPAYAPVIHGEAGLIQRTANTQGVRLHDLPLSVADTNASLHGLVGILAALHMRDRTGKGQHIDIAMIEATVATDDQLHYDLDQSKGTGPLPNEIWELPFGPVLLSTDFRLLFRLMTSDLGLVDPSMPEMELEEKIRVRRQAVAEFMATLNTPDKFTRAMATINIAWGYVRDPSKITEQPTLQARGTFTEVDDRAGGKRHVVQSPYRFSGAKSGVRGSTAHRGEHHHDVLGEWLNLPSSAIDALHKQAVLHFDPDWRHH